MKSSKSATIVHGQVEQEPWYERLDELIKKYSFVHIKNHLFSYFQHDLQKFMGAEKALFFLANVLSADKYLLHLYSPDESHAFRPVILDPTCCLFSALTSKTQCIELTDAQKEGLQNLIQGSGLDLQFQNRVGVLTVVQERRLLGFFLFLRPAFFPEQSAAASDASALTRLLRIASRIVKDEITELHHRQEVLERDILLKLAQKISSSLKLERVLENIIDSLRLVVPYDSAAIFLLNHKTGEIEYEIARGYSENGRELLRLKIGQGISGWVAKTGKPVIVEDVRQDPRYVNADPQTRSELAVPIKTGNKILGVFNLESHQLNAFTPHQAELLEAFASSAAIAIQNARLYKLALEKKELEKDLQLARRIQLALLPHRMPHSKKVFLSAYSQSSKQVGGDLYDAVKFADGKLAVAVADVSGKGVPGALLMASLYTIYRTEIRRNLPAHKLVGIVNRHFCETASDGNFATLFHAIIDPENESVEYCNAGHNPAILVTEAGDVQFLESTGLILGFTKDARFQSRKIDFRPGDVLVIYSDGITEAENSREELFGKERLAGAIKKHRFEKPANIKKFIIDEVMSFSRNGFIHDDITLVVAKFMPKLK